MMGIKNRHQYGDTGNGYYTGVSGVRNSRVIIG